MPIVALGQSAIRAIGSTSALPDPSSVVKELLDNALDAGATSVSVEISLNTLDIIQVKDNGSGILPDDRLLACKRNYTSKIQTKEDLASIGGKWLGFRGQALASIAEMSDALHITTRVKEEQVASLVKFGRGGEPLRQTAGKNANKCILNLKKLLHTYTVARPYTRLSLRLLKSKDNGWVYAPNAEPSVRDAISKMIGPAVVANCVSKSFSSSIPKALNGSDIVTDGDDTYRIHISTIIPNPSTDLSAVNHKGQYVVIDGRPMSTSRGFGIEVFRRFKLSLRQAIDGDTSIADPFMFISLDCPPGIYDINIESSKDDALFENPQAVLFIIETFFKGIYCTVVPNSHAVRPTEDDQPPSTTNPAQNSFYNGTSGTECNQTGCVSPAVTTSAPLSCPGTLSLPPAIQLRDPDSQLLTPGRDTTSPSKLFSTGSPSYRNKAQMRQAPPRIDAQKQLLTLSKRDSNADSINSRQTTLRFVNRPSPNNSEGRIDTRHAQLRYGLDIDESEVNESIVSDDLTIAMHERFGAREAISTQRPSIDVSQVDNSRLHTPTRIVTRSPEGFHALRPQTPPVSLANVSHVTKGPENLKIARSMVPLPQNQNIDNAKVVYGQVPPRIRTSPSRTNGLECVSVEDSACDIPITCSHSISDFSNSVKKLIETDNYMKSGTIVAAFLQSSSKSEITNYWTRRLDALVKQPSFRLWFGGVDSTFHFDIPHALRVNMWQSHG
ncbi:hypothetical protein FQN49_003808 [Arthroderma sp. PD_2]|nr:hypothetical protein FQN49_003808 [Arthroderma sp. PD_2]